MKRFAVLLAFVAATALAATPAKIAPIQYHQRTLANGLQLYSVEDHSTPTVAIDVWYRVGSKNDPPARSGFAHLFEHLMFKSTAHMKSEQMDRLTEDVGGFNNATTTDDDTRYYEVVPSNYLQTLLWAEGERMGSLNVDDANFKSERDVVKEEFRQRILAEPYGLFFYDVDRDSFAVHPYHRPSIGSIEDLDAATLADVQAFHRTYYRPDNAVVIVAGDFDPKQLDAWVDRYLGSIPKPATPIPRVEVKEPARAETKRFDEHAPNVPLPAVAITWLAPAASSADAVALEVAGTILSGGESSRLYQALIYRDKIAQEASADADLREDLGLFVASATMATGHTAAEGEKALLRELKALEDTPPTARELAKAKNLLLTSALRERETNEGKASAVGEAVVVEHDAEEVNRGLQRLEQVTAADVQRVLRKYVAETKPVVITYSSEQRAASSD